MLTDEIKNGESSVLEFKRELPTDGKKYLKTIVAFANGKGGRIIFGVDDKTLEIVGVDKDKVFLFMDAIANAVSDVCEPMIVPDIKMQTIDDNLVIVVEVHQGQNKPYYLKAEGITDGTYVRVGATSRPATIEKIKELMLYGANRYFDEQPYSEEPVSEEKIAGLCKVISAYSHKTVTENQLLSWGLLLNDESGNKVPSNAFELMTDNRLPFTEIQCGRFKGNEKLVFIDKRDIKGPVYQQIEKSCQFVLEHINLGAEIKGLRRVEAYEIPEEAIREICTNAVVHRNYLQRSYIQIAVFDDRIEIKSPGALYGGLTIEEVKRGGSSIRNKVLADVLNKMGFVEHWGTGVMRVIALCKDAGLCEPSIVEDGEYVVFTFYRKALVNAVADVDKSEESPKKVPHEIENGTHEKENVPHKTSDKQKGSDDNSNECPSRMSLTNVSHESDNVPHGYTSHLSSAIMKMIVHNNKVTREEIAKMTGVTVKTIQRQLNKMKDMVRYVGSGNNGHWEIISNKSNEDCDKLR